MDINLIDEIDHNQHVKSLKSARISKEDHRNRTKADAKEEQSDTNKNGTVQIQMERYIWHKHQLRIVDKNFRRTSR